MLSSLTLAPWYEAAWQEEGARRWRRDGKLDVKVPENWTTPWICHSVVKKYLKTKFKSFCSLQSLPSVCLSDAKSTFYVSAWAFGCVHILIKEHQRPRGMKYTMSELRNLLFRELSCFEKLHNHPKWCLSQSEAGEYNAHIRDSWITLLDALMFFFF